MGGFGSGGRRVGSGRKSKRTAERKISGARPRTRALDADSPAVTGGPMADVPMPSWLSADEAAAWRELAPSALGAGTLVAATASAFVDLVEVVALRRRMMTAIREQGIMVDGAPHPLLAQERQYRLREEVGKTRFMLSPIGKPMTGKAAEVDPFAAFDLPPSDVSVGGQH